MLRPRTAKTFKAYATAVFEPYILSQLQHVERLDISGIVTLLTA